MILAAYLVTCFLVASVYAVGMLRGRRDRHHRLGLLIPLTVGCILAPVEFMVGDTAAREIAKDQPIKFAAIECVQHTHRDVTEYLGGACTSDGVKGGIGIPGLDSLLVGFSTDTEVTGLDTVPADDRPPANTLLHPMASSSLLWDELPDAANWDEPPWWYVLAIPTLAGAVVALALRLPGGGGHAPIEGIGLKPPQLLHLPGILLASLPDAGGRDCARSRRAAGGARARAGAIAARLLRAQEADGEGTRARGRVRRDGDHFRRAASDAAPDVRAGRGGRVSSARRP